VPDPETEPPPTDRRAADLAHELGNRLAAIVAFSHLIRTDPRLPDDLHDQAELLVQEADRTRALVEELLESAAPRAAGASTDVPAAARVATPEPAAVATDPSGAPARILVVDDEPAIRDFLARILRRIGHEPVLAADGATALAIVRSEPPDAILCDHRMGAMSGAAFNDAVAETRPELARHFALMTGDASNPELRAVADARGIVLLAKPFDIESVERTVAAILEG
jgi:CheY-like chemotaxis protein